VSLWFYLEGLLHEARFDQITSADTYRLGENLSRSSGIDDFLLPPSPGKRKNSVISVPRMSEANGR
jgi:hypothetical protein